MLKLSLAIEESNFKLFLRVGGGWVCWWVWKMKVEAEHGNSYYMVKTNQHQPINDPKIFYKCLRDFL